MKNRLLIVCFCVFTMTSMAMAAGFDSIVASGFEDITLGNNLDVLSSVFDAPATWDGDIVWLISTSHMVPTFPDWDPYEEDRWMEDVFEFNLPDWNYALLSYSDGWLLVHDDYESASGNAVKDGLLSLPSSMWVIDAFSNAWFINTNYLPFDDDRPVPAPVPEPGTLALLTTGFIGLGFAARRKFQAKK